ncbi:MAG: hypothetical protein ACKO2W_01270, partial [Vulcanococcus sp.]
MQGPGFAAVRQRGGDGAHRHELSRVLRNDPGIGVIRHADAGYDIAAD